MSRKFIICCVLMIVPVTAFADALLFPDAVARYNNGLKKQQERKDEEAVAEYRVGLMLMGNKAELLQKYVLNNLAVMALERGELGPAEALLKQALALDPKYKAAINNLGLLYYRKGDTTAAIKTWSQIMSFPDKYLLEGSKTPEELPVK